MVISCRHTVAVRIADDLNPEAGPWNANAHLGGRHELFMILTEVWTLDHILIRILCISN